MARADSFDSSAQFIEIEFVKGLGKLLTLLPELREAFLKVIAPEERAQFIRGLERMDTQLGELLESKQMIINALSVEPIDADRLRTKTAMLNGTRLSDALKFINPIHFPQTFQAKSTKVEKQGGLRHDFDIMQSQIEQAIQGKTTASVLLTGINNQDLRKVPDIVSKLKESMSKLETVQKVLHQTLSSLRE